MQAERGAWTTQQSATDSQLDIRHSAALVSLLPCYGFSGPEVLLLPALGDTEELQNSKALGDRPCDCMASYRDAEKACLLYLRGMMIAGGRGATSWLSLDALCTVRGRYMLAKLNVKDYFLFTVAATLSSWEAHDTPAPGAGRFPPFSNSYNLASLTQTLRAKRIIKSQNTKTVS